MHSPLQQCRILDLGQVIGRPCDESRQPRSRYNLVHHRRLTPGVQGALRRVQRGMGKSMDDMG